MSYRVLHGDCLELMRAFPVGVFDALVTDPPAGISFMGKKWDSDGGDQLKWMRWLGKRMREAYRVMKPGAFGLVWAIPRTSHLTAMACQLAGFSIENRFTHMFAKGMPHGCNIGLAIDDVLGVPHETTGSRMLGGNAAQSTAEKGGTYAANTSSVGVAAIEVPIKRPGSPEGKAWEGWNTGLKPAVEDWWLVQKPIAERTIARQVLATRTGGLNIPACRIGTNDITSRVGTRAGSFTAQGSVSIPGTRNQRDSVQDSEGRWPSHLLFTHAPGCELVGSAKVKAAPSWNENHAPSSFTGDATSPVHHSDADGTETVDEYQCVEGCPVKALNDQNAGASRYFTQFLYCTKASKKDRHSNGAVNNTHPTVKPRTLMEWLCTLITPPGGIILDPFTGSGSTGAAAILRGFEFLGIELEIESARIAMARIDAAAREYAQRKAA